MASQSPTLDYVRTNISAPIIPQDNNNGNDSLVTYLHKLCRSETIEKFNFCYCLEPEFNKLCKNVATNHEISIFHMNIRKLNANQNGLMQLLHCVNNDFDIIILFEIWSNNIDFYRNLIKG